MKIRNITVYFDYKSVLGNQIAKRYEGNETITWIVGKDMWKKIEGTWYQLAEDYKLTACDEPDCEKEYRQLITESLL